jgi:hypothetical protein
MFTRTVLTVALAAFALPAAAQADTYSHIDGLALRLQKNTRLLDREFSTHYRHTAGYRHLRSDSVEMARAAGRLHEVAHEHGSLSHLQSDLRQIDRLFHHLEDLVNQIEHEADFDDHHGRFGGYGGHIHGDTSDVRRLMNSIEDAIHHLQSDLAELAGGDRDRRDPRFRGDGPVVYPGFRSEFPGAGAAPPGYVSGNNGPVIRFSRPGFSIQLGR